MGTPDLDDVERLAGLLEEHAAAFLPDDSLMKQWDGWRTYIKDGGGGSWPRDAFEALVDGVGQDCRRASAMLLTVARERDALRQIISRCAEATGAAVGPGCSLEFMSMLPEEIRLGRERREAESFRRGEESMREKAAEVAWYHAASGSTANQIAAAIRSLPVEGDQQ